VNKRSDGFLASAARYTAIAMTLPASTFAGYLIGYGLDSWLHTTYLKIVFLILGILSGFVQLIRQLMRDMNSKSK
jgi:F0F1-type ATP synthase assembly protein I